MNVKASMTRWTKKENALLVKLAQKHLPFYAIARKIGRTLAATKQHANSMGIRMQPLHKKFTTEDDAILTRPDLSLDEKARLLGRTRGSCCLRLFRMRQEGKLTYCGPLEAAAITGLSGRQLSGLCRQGVFVHWRPTPRSLLFDLADLHRVLKEQPEIIATALERRKKRIGKEKW